MISGIISQGTLRPRGALSLSAMYFDSEGIASPIVVGADSQIASSTGLHVDADGFFATRFVRALIPLFKADDSIILAPRIRSSQVLQPLLHVAVDVLSLPAVALPGILQTHFHAADDAIFSPFIESHGSLRPSLFNAFDAVYAPTLVAAQTLRPSLYTASDTLYAPTARIGIRPSLVTASDVIFAADIPQSFAPALVTDAEAFFAPIVAFPATLDGPVVSLAMSSGNLVATVTSAGTTAGVRSTALKTVNKYYFEITAGLFHDVYTGAGIGLTTLDYSGMTDMVRIGINSTGVGIAVNSTVSPYSLGPAAPGNIFGFAVDLDNRLFWVRRSGGLWNGDSSANPITRINGVTIPAGSWAPFVRFATGSLIGDNLTANFGQSAFVTAAPAGFGKWTA